jgi:hypothetical protein
VDPSRRKPLDATNNTQDGVRATKYASGSDTKFTPEMLPPTHRGKEKSRRSMLIFAIAPQTRQAVLANPLMRFSGLPLTGAWDTSGRLDPSLPIDRYCAEETRYLYSPPILLHCMEIKIKSKVPSQKIQFIKFISLNAFPSSSCCSGFQWSQRNCVKKILSAVAPAHSMSEC